jgi:SAM-dependent methyltransferase
MSVFVGHELEIAQLYATIADYYTQKIRRYGATPLGVDWSCIPTQELRFVQLLKLCDFRSPFSLNDLGCGYGALLSYLSEHHVDTEIDYLGVDLSAAMVRRARRLWRNSSRAKFVIGETSPRFADYSVASGIFNVQLDQPIHRWERFVAKTLGDMRARSRRGFAVNFIGPLPAAFVPRAGLYRTPPQPWMQYCERELDSSVELVANYGLREFTLLIRN